MHKYAKTLCIYMQNICKNIRVDEFAYGAYICAPHFADGLPGRVSFKLKLVTVTVIDPCLAGPGPGRRGGSGKGRALGARAWDPGAGIALSTPPLRADVVEGLLPGGTTHGLLAWLVSMAILCLWASRHSPYSGRLANLDTAMRTMRHCLSIVATGAEIQRQHLAVYIPE